MRAKNKKKQITKITVFITSVFVIFMSITYAFVTQVLTGEKQVVVSAGVLDLVLEEENAITISDALPMYDQVGMIQEDVFKFRLVNKTSNSTDYILKLSKIASDNELQPSDVKYYLTKEGVGEPKLLSSLTDGIIDTGTITGNDTIDYTLRLWIRDGVTDQTAIAGKSLSYKLVVEAGQEGTLVTEKVLSIDWMIEDGYSETLQLDASSYFVKISDEIVTTENILGLDLYIEINNELMNCGENCIIVKEAMTQEMFDEIFKIDETSGMISFNDILIFMPETFTADGMTMSAGVWIMTIVNSDDNTLIPTVNALQLGEPQPEKTVTFTYAGVTKEATYPTRTMFNYSSEGCITDLTTNETKCLARSTNGIYVKDDEDGPSYFYRGTADNLVEFGEYSKDYYVYRYTSNDEIRDFVSLEACQSFYSECTEENKVLKYNAGTPMYWRIVRINGDGTIRMIYAGTTPDAHGEELGIGLSQYNNQTIEPKYAGYTYDILATETASEAKRDVDEWYNIVFKDTKYDSDIVYGKFCSDSSGYDVNNWKFGDYSFASFRRLFSNMIGTGNSNPTFKCPVDTDPNFGGNYSLKVGLITTDEVLAAGGQVVQNTSFYLHDESSYGALGFWTMTPMVFNTDPYPGVGAYIPYYLGIMPFGVKVDPNAVLRPVINLRADVVFKEGTDGSVLTPYELAD